MLFAGVVTAAAEKRHPSQKEEARPCVYHDVIVIIPVSQPPNARQAESHIVPAGCRHGHAASTTRRGLWARSTDLPRAPTHVHAQRWGTTWHLSWATWLPPGPTPAGHACWSRHAACWTWRDAPAGHGPQRPSGLSRQSPYWCLWTRRADTTASSLTSTLTSLHHADMECSC